MGQGPPAPCGCGAVVGLCLFLMLLPVDVGLCCGALLVSDAADFLWFLVPPPFGGCVDGSWSPPLWMWGCGGALLVSDAAPCGCGAMVWGSACF